MKKIWSLKGQTRMVDRKLRTLVERKVTLVVGFVFEHLMPATTCIMNNLVNYGVKMKINYIYFKLNTFVSAYTDC